MFYLCGGSSRVAVWFSLKPGNDTNPCMFEKALFAQKLIFAHLCTFRKWSRVAQGWAVMGGRAEQMKLSRQRTECGECGETVVFSLIKTRLLWSDLESPRGPRRFPPRTLSVSISAPAVLIPGQGIWWIWGKMIPAAAVWPSARQLKNSISTMYRACSGRSGRGVGWLPYPQLPSGKQQLDPALSQP